MGTIVLAPEKTFVFPIEDPVSGDNVHRLYVNRAFTVKRIVALKEDGGGSFDFEVRHSPNADDQGAGTLIHSDTGVSSTTTGVVYVHTVDFALITVPKADYIWIEAANVSTGITRPVGLVVHVIGSESGP